MSDWNQEMMSALQEDGDKLHALTGEDHGPVFLVDASPKEIAGFALRMVVERMAFRIDAMNERGLDGVSISKGFATEIVNACRRGSELLENPKPAQAGLTVGGGSGSANVSEGVTAEREPAGEAGGEAEGHLKLPEADDPPANPAAIAGPSLLRPAEKPYDYRCDCCDNGLNAEWDFCPFCGLCQREQPSGLCLAGLASNKACRPDDTLKRCTICGFVVDTQYAAEKPATHLR